MKERKPWSFCETPEVKCTMSYCDENGCQNQKRNRMDDLEHNCKYCGVKTTQPDEVCYANPNNHN